MAIKSLDNWSGEKNATAVEQENNTYVSKAEHEELRLAEVYRQEWSSIDNNDWKAIKEFIDRHATSTHFLKFMETAEKKQAGVVSHKMPPLTYLKWQIIQGQSEYKSLGGFIAQLIDVVYENHAKQMEQKSND